MVTINCSEPRYCITLVHGTFARDAEWIKEGSALRTGIEQYLGGTVVFDPFQWSGDNSTRARRAAGLELHERLLLNRSRFPRASHFVIGHSHGGTVALHARKADRSEHMGPDGIVTIATPYLSFLPRRTPWYLAPMIGWVWLPIAWLFALTVGIVGAVILVVILTSGVIHFVPKPGGAALVVVAAALPWIAYRVLVTSIDKGLRPLYRRVRIAIAVLQNRFVSLGPWPIPKTRVLNLQVTFDEPTWLLWTIDQIASFTQAIGNIATGLFLLGALALWNAIDTQISNASIAGAILSFGCWMVPAVLLYTMAFVCHGSTVVLASLFRAHRFGFGSASLRESVLQSLLVRVLVGSQPHPNAGYQQRTDEGVSIPYPLGGWLVQHLLWPPHQRTPAILPPLPTPPTSDLSNLKVASLRGNPWRRFSLRHSELYVTKELIEVIAGWLLLTTQRGDGQVEEVFQ